MVDDSFGDKDTRHRTLRRIRRRDQFWDPTAFRKQHKLAEAQSASENAQKAWRELAKTEPATESRLAAALYNQGVLRAETGDHDAARANFNEALALAVPWAVADPLAHADLLATIVKGARRLMEETGEKPEEWPALQEAEKFLAGPAQVPIRRRVNHPL